MKRLFLISAMVALVALSACSTLGDEEQSVGVAKSTLSIGLPVGISRTAMSDEGNASWVEGDTFTLWAENRTGGFNLNGVDFTMMYFLQSYQSAIFTSFTNTLADGEYTYYAVSPKPQSIEARKATYTLPFEQIGTAPDGAYDLMVATPVTAESLSDAKINNLAMEFNHKTHIFKMIIPKRGNPLNNPVQQVVFTFPTTITGSVTLDATNPDAAPAISNGSKQLVVNVTEGFDEGETAWARIAECNISGNVTYYAISTLGERTFERTFKMDKECKGGHITPLSLIIPEPIPPTVLRVKVGKNNLGEAVQTISIIDDNGKTLKSFVPNAENIYDLEQYGIYEDGLFQTYTGRTFTVRFESSHAIVEKKVTIPSIITKYEVNNVATIDVPYLFYEDFTSIHTSFEKDDARVSSLMSADGILLNNYMSVSGWNGAHIKGVAGKAVRVNVHHESAFSATRSNGRLDSPAMKALKSGVNVTLKVEFTMGAYANSGYNNSNEIFCIAGTHSLPETSPINGKTNTTSSLNDYDRIPGLFSSVCLTTGYIAQKCGDNSFGDTFDSYSFIANGCTSATRFGWVPCCVQKETILPNNAHYYLYIDNIRVSIAQ